MSKKCLSLCLLCLGVVWSGCETWPQVLDDGFEVGNVLRVETRMRALGANRALMATVPGPDGRPMVEIDQGDFIYCEVQAEGRDLLALGKIFLWEVSVAGQTGQPTEDQALLGKTFSEAGLWKISVKVSEVHSIAYFVSTAHDSVWVKVRPQPTPVVVVPPLPTPIDCVMSAWSAWVPGAWSACVDSRQTREEMRTRTVLTHPQNGGEACPSNLVETRTVSQACTVEPEPVDCAVSAWALSSYGAWSSCENNVQTREETWMRTVLTQPANGGQACPTLSETRIATRSCSDCVVSDWTLSSYGDWSTCNGSQETRSETWTRTVLVPPSNGGATCPGLSEMRTGTRSCTIEPEPVDCVVSGWYRTSVGPWLSCDGNEQTRNEIWERDVLVEPSNGGVECPELAEVRVGTRSCSDCEVSAWYVHSTGAWSSCVNGRRSRQVTYWRDVEVESSNGGAECPPLEKVETETETCQVTPVTVSILSPLPGECVPMDEPVYFSAVAYGGTPPYSYHWFLPPGINLDSTDDADFFYWFESNELEFDIEDGVLAVRVTDSNGVESEIVQQFLSVGNCPG